MNRAQRYHPMSLSVLPITIWPCHPQPFIIVHPASLVPFYHDISCRTSSFPFTITFRVDRHFSRPSVFTSNHFLHIYICVTRCSEVNVVDIPSINSRSPTLCLSFLFTYTPLFLGLAYKGKGKKKKSIGLCTFLLGLGWEECLLFSRGG